MRIKSFILLLVLSLVVTGVSWGVNAESVIELEEIRIGVFEPMTGPLAAGGQMTWEGIELANEVKSEVLGVPVRLILGDSRSEKVEAANVVARLIRRDNVHAIVGSYGSSLAMAAGPLIEDAKIPTMGCSPTNPLVTLGNPYYFRACFIDPFQGRVMAQYAYEELGAETAAIIQDVAQDYSVGLANFFRQAFIDFTGDPESVVTMVSYQTGDRDYSAQLSHVNNLNPDVIFTPGYFGDVAIMINQARGLGMDQQFLGGDALEAPEFIDIGGEDVEGVIISTHYSSDVPITPASEEFIDEFRDKYGQTPNAFAALGYEAYMMLLHAIEVAESVDGDTVREVLANIDGYEGVTGYITIDENGDSIKSAVVLAVEDGEFRYKSTVQP